MATIPRLEEEFQAFVRQLGRRIRAIRTAKQHSQTRISEEAGIYDVGALERGKAANPRLYTLFALARTLDVELKELLDAGPARGAGEESEQIFIRIREILRDRDLKTQRKALDLLQVFLAD